MSGNNVLEFVIRVKDLTKSALTSARARIASFAQNSIASFKTLGANLMNIKAGLDMAVGAVRTFAGFFAGAIREAFKFESALANFKVLLGSIDAANKHLAELREFASRTPLTFNDLSAASKMLLSFGISVNDVMPALKTLGDISMGNAQKFQGLALVFGQVKSAGRLMGQDLLQMINQGFNPLTIIAKETGKSMVELKEMMAEGAISFEMVQAAMESATGAGGLFDNAMGEAATTGEGLMSSLEDNWTEAVRTFGEAFMGTAKGGVQKLLDKLTELLESGQIQVWAQDAAHAVMSIGSACMKVFGWLGKAWSAVKGGIGGVAAFAGTLAGGGNLSDAKANMAKEWQSAWGEGDDEKARKEQAVKEYNDSKRRASEEARQDETNAQKKKTLADLIAEAEAKKAEERARKEAEKAEQLAKRKAELEAKAREHEEKERLRLEEKIHRQKLRLEAEAVRTSTEQNMALINNEIAALQAAANAWEDNAKRARGVDFGDWARGERDREKDARTAANKQVNREKLVDQEIARLEGMGDKARSKWGNDRLAKLRAWKEAQDPANNKAADDVLTHQKKAADMAQKSEQHLADIAKRMDNLGL